MPRDPVAARQRRRTGAAVIGAGAGVAGVALVGSLLSIPDRDGPPADTAGRTMTTAAPANGQVAASSFPNAVRSQAYATISPGPDTTAPPYGVPPRDAPLPPTGTCPTSVDLMRLPVHDPWDAATWPRRVTAVTLCRYDQSTFDTYHGDNALTQGPVDGDLAVFAPALAKAMPAVRPIDHMGCRIVNPGPPYTVDIVFVTASGDTGKAYVMLRTVCDPPWLEDPERTLEEAVDAVLGPPY